MAVIYMPHILTRDTREGGSMSGYIDGVKNAIDLYLKRQRLEADVRDTSSKLDSLVKNMTESQVRAYEALKAVADDPNPNRTLPGTEQGQ